MKRRQVIAGGAAALLGGGTAAAQHAGHGAPLPEARPAQAPFSALRDGAPHHLTPEQEAQRVTGSNAPPGVPGRWVGRAALPIPRSEMAWATAWAGRMHVVGGYGEGRVDRTYHHIYDPAGDRWFNGAPLPRGANHVSVAAHEGRIYALGGFIEQNRNPDHNAYAYEVDSDRWVKIAPLPRPRGAGAAEVLNGRVHLIGGASEPTLERASVGWHEAYDPKTDTWQTLKALPGARDHVGSVVHQNRIHVVGGRFNTFEYNTALHHVYVPERDTWEERAPLPTVRSGHGMVVYRGRFFTLGGEAGLIDRGRISEARVFGQVESYDPATDTWQSHAAMPTPRHAPAAVAIGDWIYVAGGGAVTGGAVQSSVHEAFTLG